MSTGMEDSAQTAAVEHDGRRSVVVGIAKFVLFAAVLYFVGRALLHQLALVSWSELEFDPYLMAAAMAVMLAAKALLFLPYRFLIAGFCRPPGLRPVMGAIWLGQMGKYLPGKVGTIVWIALLLQRHKVPRHVAVSVILIAVGLLVALGMLVAIPLLLWEPVRACLPAAWLWCLLAAAAGICCLHPRVFGAAINFLLRRLRREPIETLHRIRDLVIPIVAFLVQFSLLGLSYWLMARSITDVGVATIPVFISSAVTVTVVGFLAFFAPAGLGVQEGLLLVLLGPLIGPDLAAVVTVVMRLMQILAEAPLAVVGYGLLYRLAGREPS